MASKRFSSIRGAIACAALTTFAAGATASVEPVQAEPLESRPADPDNVNPDNPVCQGDFNGDGVINFFDMADFIQAFLNHEPDADIMPPWGVWNFVDVQRFVTYMHVGCPTP